MCDVQELCRRVCKEREGKGDTGRLGRHKKTQETARRLQETARRPQGKRRETQETARKTQGDAGNQVARLSEE